MSQNQLIDVRNVKKYFNVGTGKNKNQVLKAVDNISLTIYENEIVGVVGESGSGKSTLGRCMMNLLPIDDGQIVYQNKRIDNCSGRSFLPYRRKIQMIFQNPLASFDGRQYIGSAFRELAKVHRISYKEINHQLISILTMINLSAEVLNRRPRELSGGQLQRLAIARALLLNPELLIADEPVSALDVSVQAQILNLMMDIRDKMGLGIMFISHDLNMVEKVCDRVAVLYLGALMEIASKDELFHRTAHPYTKSLIDAKPKTHPLEIKEAQILKGEIPNAIDYKRGCRFAGRCPSATSKCESEEPKMEKIAENHYVACFYPLGKTAYGKECK